MKCSRRGSLAANVCRLAAACPSAHSYSPNSVPNPAAVGFCILVAEWLAPVLLPVVEAYLDQGLKGVLGGGSGGHGRRFGLKVRCAAHPFWGCVQEAPLEQLLWGARASHLCWQSCPALRRQHLNKMSQPIQGCTHWLQTLLVGVLLGTTVVLFSLKTLHRNTEWYDEERLFRAAQKVRTVSLWAGAWDSRGWALFLSVFP